jgi:hypothetical protein
MKNENELDKLYISCMNCTKDCQGIWKDINNGVPPRGFFYIDLPIDILVVAKNPGHPLKNKLKNPQYPLPDESETLKVLKDSDLYYGFREFVKSYFSDLRKYTDSSTRFHKNLFNYLSEILNIKNKFDFEEIFKRIALTNLLKCSTCNEQAILKKNIIDKCYNTYFTNEIKYLKPKVILALGKEVFNYLEEKQNDLKIPIVYIKHPAFPYPGNRIPDIKKEEIIEKLNKVS